jgi:hypothetical protein
LSRALGVLRERLLHAIGEFDELATHGERFEAVAQGVSHA